MKSLLITLTFIIASPCYAISNRLIGDLKDLRKIGFDITHVWQGEEGVISFNFVVPAKFTFDSGGTEITKPFSGISYLRTMRPVGDRSRILGAPASQLNLASHPREDHRHECRITLLTSDVSNSFFAVYFVRPEGGTWPMVIHIPVAKLVQQIEAEQGGAVQPATAPEPKSEGKENPDQESRARSR